MESDSFCDCKVDTEYIQCQCGEDFNADEWSWEENAHNRHVKLSCNQRQVLFHPSWSVGTAAVRGTTPFAPGRQYVWEIKMLSSIHGTDVVVGIGSAQVDLTAYSQRFIALLGKDSESWGFSYKGDIIHDGCRKSYGPTFGKGSIVGVHLNMWTGNLEFYLNRQRLGVAFRIMKNKVLFPMISSTMGHSSMRLISTMSWPTTLELLCLQSLSPISQLSQIPGLKALWGNTFWWKQATEAKRKLEEQPLEYELEIISSDEEERENIIRKSRKVSQRRQKRRSRSRSMLKSF